MKRLIKWLVILLLAAAAGIFAWGYAPDTDAAQMESKYSSAASRFAELEPGCVCIIAMKAKPMAAFSSSFTVQMHRCTHGNHGSKFSVRIIA